MYIELETGTYKPRRTVLVPFLRGSNTFTKTATKLRSLPGVEDAYMRGEPLTPPEIEFSEYSDMEDDYWAWHQEDQVFRHWDEDLGDWSL
ncbi:hypothetical protein FPSE_10747 [Fusarium pseudograminearum CS3096]|uniref:Uncharacterized protein n=1 Tax=Fusarium pseudograminearum (strain CS3096) TaxID=1028729 RepID=K3VAA8_FUSPC|nr:hypothetical protein FPSE_10747 [Fusarium pseudograminearum CS3096]EKJ69078.1 hypothetical protein FPSE_10747 [Fusarium pseudograminearum CS3096]